MTIEQRATNADTWQHINRVQHYLFAIVRDLSHRAEIHDQSKLQTPEVELFTEVDGQLHGLTYGSAEYTAQLVKLKPALDHHYAHNRHHPEHWADGVEDMNLVDLIEMLCDWKAATERHADGDIRRSIEINTERFGLSPQLARILRNTVKDIIEPPF